MIHSLIEFSLRQRLLVMLATGALIFAGLWSARLLPIDAVPDVTNVQVRVDTEVETLAPEEIERLVTFPIESAMAACPVCSSCGRCRNSDSPRSCLRSRTAWMCIWRANWYRNG
jgi:Cu/Ag efflux pump CusA